MKDRKNVVSLVAVLLLAGQALAQTDDPGPRADEAREAEVEHRLMQAEQQMAEAARQIAEITTERLPGMLKMERHIALSDKPRLGVTIGAEEPSGPVEGVTITGVTPGSAASDAGLRAGDVITAMNGESMSASEVGVANERLLDFMKGVVSGDVLKVEYLRDGKVGSVEVEPRVVENSLFAWHDDSGRHFAVPQSPNAPIAPGRMMEFKMPFGFPWAGTGLGELELVALSKGLGRYFGTDSGLLVISAPKSGAFELQDGDVIQSIDGREPRDVRHAMRILSSYQGGEALKLGIMRDKKKRTLDVEIPANQRGALFDEPMPPLRPAEAPLPAAPPAPAVEPVQS